MTRVKAGEQAQSLNFVIAKNHGYLILCKSEGIKSSMEETPPKGVSNFGVINGDFQVAGVRFSVLRAQRHMHCLS